MINTKPVWLRKKMPDTTVLFSMKNFFNELTLHTVCEDAECPNQGECFAEKTATFLILGNVCTRSCKFCAISKRKPTNLPDANEPENVALAVCKLCLDYVVITSVTRDDLVDGGSAHFSETIAAIRQHRPEAKIEVLVPDFKGSDLAIRTVAKSQPDVLNHNIETVYRLYNKVRPEADYNRSLELLKKVKSLNSKVITKSGIMLGLGENRREILFAMEDLRQAGCDILTIGQYLRPSEEHYQVKRFIPPDEFEVLKKEAYALGFKGVASAPFVRSSYKADAMYRQSKLCLAIPSTINKAAGLWRGL